MLGAMVVHLFSKRRGRWRRFFGRRTVRLLATLIAGAVAGVVVALLNPDMLDRAKRDLLPAISRLIASPAASAHALLMVVDGDTVRDSRTGETYRIANIDTPETGDRARCRAERTLGDQATSEARRLLAAAREVRLRPIGRRDRYGRALAHVEVDGRDFGEHMIESELARPWRGRREPWCTPSGGLVR